MNMSFYRLDRKIWGEKFIIVLNNTRAKKVYKVAEKIRKRLEATIFKYGDSAVSIISRFNISTRRTVCYLERGVKMNEKDTRDIKRQRLSVGINDLRKVLNEVCLMQDDIKKNEEILIVSRHLDELIVEYMKQIENK